MACRALASWSLTAAVLAAGSLALQAQRPADAAARRHLDLRDDDAARAAARSGGEAVLTPAEAADYERQTIARQATTNNTAGPDWWDPGTRVSDQRPHVADRRSA